MDVWVVATGLIFIYLFFTIAVGITANRQLSVSLEDFLLYGRQTGFVVLYLTVVATFHSAFAFLGSGGFFLTHGLGFWVAGAWTVLVGAIVTLSIFLIQTSGLSSQMHLERTPARRLLPTSWQP